MEGSQQEFLEKVKRQSIAYRNYFLRVEVLVDMILDKNKEIEKLKNDKRVLEETLWEEGKGKYGG